MPTFEFSFNDFKKLVDKKLPNDKEKLWELLLKVKTEVEELRGDNLKLELADTNRPDMWCVEGLSRALRGALDIETGIVKYSCISSEKRVIVNKNVKKIRPFIAGAIIKGLKLDNEIIKQLMQLQLKLDTTFGRNRKKSSIGIYDSDLINFPVKYETMKPEDIIFTPLGFNKNINAVQILEEHPKGKEFGKILKGFEKYPILLDSDNKILSLPPIINSNSLGKVTTKTRNVFVEVTGTHLKTVIASLNIIASTLIERGGKAESVIINYGNKKVVTPDFSTKTFNIKKSSIKKRLGLELKNIEIKELLRQARFDVKKQEKDLIEVIVPFYRTDIMHEVDIIEDIGIMYGYENIESTPVEISTNGRLHDSTSYNEKIRNIIVGMNYQEVLTYTRTDEEVLQKKGFVEIANPIGTKMNCLRNELIPLLLDFLSKNTHYEYPQKVFEIGKIFNKKKSKIVEEDHVCLISTHLNADFTESKQALEWIMNNLGIKYEIKQEDNEYYISGRSGTIIVKGKKVGTFGEVNPKLLTKFNLENPAINIEINIKKIK